MAISSSKTLDHWREVFRAAGESDVFHVIRQAIRVAASDHPDEFRIRKDKIVQMLVTAIPRVENVDEGHRNAVKAKEEKEDDGRDNAVKAIEEEEKSGRGDPVKSVGALLAARTTPPSEQKPPRAAVAVDDFEEKAETKRQETWKIVSVSTNGKIRLRRVLHDQTTPSKPQTTITEHPPDKPLNLEGSLPTEHHLEPRNQLEGSHHPDPVIAHSEPLTDQEGTHHHEPVISQAEPRNDQEGSLGSNLEAAKPPKRKLREGYQPFEPRPKKFCRRPLQFRISGARLLR